MNLNHGLLGLGQFLPDFFGRVCLDHVQVFGHLLGQQVTTVAYVDGRFYCKGAKLFQRS